ncbi:hypothetical protein AYO41_04750 [Verrucomicrobia bacterium SCGC AG-212-E04]|nr:hypothetical protein AYO41_04750 [Verrucomicrobia bacterium SCGC AG-212-E04]
MPKPELPSSAEEFRSPRIAVPNSVRPVSLRTSPSAVPSAMPPTSAPRTISFAPTGGMPAPEAYMTEAPEPPAPQAPATAEAQPVPDVNVTLELGDFVDRIPPSFLRPGPVNRKQPVVFHAADLYSDLSKGRASVPLSIIHGACQEIFAKPVSSTEDVEVVLPLQKLVEQMSGALKQRGDQVMDEDVGQIDTPFLQVALEDKARLPQGAPTGPTYTPPPATPAPAFKKPPTGPIPVAAPSFGQIRPPSGPVPLVGATEAPPAPAAPLPSAPPPIMGDAAPAGKRLPSTVRASVSGGKIRLSGPSLPPQRVVPAGFGTAPIPPRSIAPSQPAQQAPVTALTSKKTARIQLPPIALRSTGTSAASAPPVFNKGGVPPAAPPPAARAPIVAAPSGAFRTPTVPSPSAPLSMAPPSSAVPLPVVPAAIAPASKPATGPIPVAPPSGPVPLPPAAEAPAAAPISRGTGSAPIRTTIVQPPIVPVAEPTAAAPSASSTRVPLSRKTDSTPISSPAPVAPLPTPPKPSTSTPGSGTGAVPIRPSVPVGGSTQIQLSLAAILRALPATALGEGMTLVDDSVRITLPFSLVEPQLAQGRVSIPREQFVAVLPADFRERFESNCELTTIPIPLQEIFQNLPMNALAMREDQIVPETGPEIPTPFGQKAAEDAQRLQSEPAIEAKAEPIAPAEPATPPPIAPPPVAPPPVAPPPIPSAPISLVPTPPAEVAAELEHIPVVGPEVTGLTPIAATQAPTPAIPTAPLPPPPKVSPLPKLEKPAAPPPLPPMVAPIPVIPVPVVPVVSAPRAVEPPPVPPTPPPSAPVSIHEPETEAPRATTRIVLGASSAPVTVQPHLKPAQLHDPMVEKAKPETTSVPLEPVGEEDISERQPPGMAELQSIFMTDETLDAKKVVRLVSKLPGITACTIMFSDGLTLAGNFPKEDGEGFSAMSPQFYRRAVAFTTELNLGVMQTYSIYTDRVVLSFFMQDDICLSVMQTGRGFLPGVREKLMSVTQELSRMYARAGAH